MDTAEPDKFTKQGFWSDHPDLSRLQSAFYSRVHVDIEPWHGSIRVVLRLEEGVTSNDIRKVIPFALVLDDKLTKWQGIRTTWHAEAFLQRHEAGHSYARIADDINRTLADFARGRAELIAEYRAVEDPDKKETFFLHANKNDKRMEYARWAREILEALRFSKEDATSIMDEAYDNVWAGRPPFSDGYPLDRDKLIGVLRYWRRKLKRKAVVKTGPRPTIPRQK